MSLNPSTEKTVSSQRFAILDCLRGISCLAVIIYHATGSLGRQIAYVDETHGFRSVGDAVIFVCCHGFVGVQIFFMISGYCIAASVVRLQRTTSGVRRYFYRRFIRIFPTYWVVLLIFCLFGLLPADWNVLTTTEGGSLLDLMATQWFGNVTLTEQWRPWVMPPDSIQFVVAVAWTLCYEEQFYFFMGVLGLLFPRYLFSILAGLTVLVVLNNYNLNIGPLGRLDLNQYQQSFDGLLIDGYWLMFASGISVFYCHSLRTRWRHLVPIVLLLLVIYEMKQGDWWTTRFLTRVVTFSVAASLCYLKAWDNAFRNSRPYGVLSWLSLRTYSIYLIHFLPVLYIDAALQSWTKTQVVPVVLFVGVPVSLVISVFLGHCLFELCERHFIPKPTTDSSESSSKISA